MAPSLVNSTLFKLPRRAEATDVDRLMASFVQLGTLLPRLESPDHQIVYGRRGTGKTHALVVLCERVSAAGDQALFVDMRSVGLSGPAAEADRPIEERGAQLLADTVRMIVRSAHGSPLAAALGRRERGRFDAASARASASVSELEVVDVSSAESTQLQSSSAERSAAGQLGFPGKANLSKESKANAEQSNTLTVVGRSAPRLVIRFGEVAAALEDLFRQTPSSRTWIMIDEWTATPRELQPLVADFLRRCLMPLRGVTVKIAAIKERSKFRTHGDIGFEVGDDISAGVSLDDEYREILDAESGTATFVVELLRGHVEALWPSEAPRSWTTTTDFGLVVFTDPTVIRALSCAAEGVPRDAFNIAINAAGRAGSERISLRDVNHAIVAWSRDDKVENLADDADVRATYSRIVEELTLRKRRRFLLGRLQSESPAVTQLQERRLLHRVGQDVRYPPDPTAAYDEWVVDYGALLARQSSDRQHPVDVSEFGGPPMPLDLNIQSQGSRREFPNGTVLPSVAMETDLAPPPDPGLREQLATRGLPPGRYVLVPTGAVQLAGAADARQLIVHRTR